MVSLLESAETELRFRRRKRLVRIACVVGLLLGLVALGASLISDEGGPVVRAARDMFAERRALEQREALESAARESGVDVYLLAGLMISESSGRPEAVSKKGALGLFQLMPATAKWRAETLGIAEPTREQLLTDPLLNARLGADNLAWLLALYDDDVEKALVAYNAGPGRLKSFIAKAGSWAEWRSERRGSGESEIFAYVDRILRYANGFREQDLFVTAEAVAAKNGESDL